jgi:hypothetical protein
MLTSFSFFPTAPNSGSPTPILLDASLNDLQPTGYGNNGFFCIADCTSSNPQNQPDWCEFTPAWGRISELINGAAQQANAPDVVQLLDGGSIVNSFSNPGCDPSLSSVDCYLQTHVCQNGDRVILQLTEYDNHSTQATGQHYVFVTGESSAGPSDWIVADPGWSAAPPTLNDHISGFTANNAFRQFPVTSALAYRDSQSFNRAALSIVAQSPVELLFTDPQGRSLGNLQTGTDAFEIPFGSYLRGFPLADDTGDGSSNGDPTGLKTLYVPTPVSGTFSLQLTGTTSGTYTLDIRAVATDGTVQDTSVTGVTNPGEQALYQITYSPQPGSTFSVNHVPIVPTIYWASPAPITFGTSLGGAQLDATANIPGTFIYSPSSGTVLGAGLQTLMVTFSPTDTADYSTATASVTLKVSPAMPIVSWTAPAPITYGTQLSGTQLDASSNVAGAFTYSPGIGTVLGAGTRMLTVSFAPTDTVDYKTANASVMLQVNPAMPIITWASPGALNYGTALSGTQLDASASVSGTFVYSPAIGTILGIGQNEVLSVNFTPLDSVDYTTASHTVTVNVNSAPYGISATAATCGAITISGSGYVDSFNSSLGTYAQTKQSTGGNVGTNGNATLSGNAKIYGSVSAPNATKGTCSSTSVKGLTTSGNASATGGLVALGQSLSFPAPPAIVPAPPTNAQSYSKSATLTPGSYGNISVSGGAVLTLTPGTYDVNSVSLSGNSTITVSPPGAVALKIAGSGVSTVLNFSGGEMSNESGIAANFQIFYGGKGTVNLSGGSNSYGVVYAPNAPITMSGNDAWYGAIVGLTITNSGNGAIHFDKELLTTFIAGFF